MRAAPAIGFKVSLIARLLRTRFDARARAIGLTRAQWRMIATIAAQEGMSQRDLAARLEINSVTAGRILDRLVAAGCVERRADPEDRRANRVYLTPDAAPILTQLSALGREEERTTIRGLTDAEEAQLEDLLQRVIDNVQSAPAPDSDPHANGGSVD
ncbi:DNA-binding transcriptional regulator, MarR family [Sphingomonas sp. YR710]|uniref:MarR family winged helix-turn-helix transcriptional regulator n=1 Tax=Sphingomonas sp. YR710 TaxID=1882773 RepID=UPI00087F6D03|nr:MarR family winged helix-turn-helix transcriptional regulator [Sphingomonas sp. YR710]SDD83647.1 DNA-binding transcriptional regulator, MarR family [Sphingomonas sp. YR710]